MDSNTACSENAASKRLMQQKISGAGFVPKETDGIREQSTHGSRCNLVSHHRRDSYRPAALYHHPRGRKGYMDAYLTSPSAASKR